MDAYVWRYKRLLRFFNWVLSINVVESCGFKRNFAFCLEKERCSYLVGFVEGMVTPKMLDAGMLPQRYCDVGEYEKAFKLMGEMEDYGVEPEVDEYNKLIQSFCVKAFDWKTAEKLLEEMKEKGVFSPGITRGLVSIVNALEQATYLLKQV